MNIEQITKYLENCRWCNFKEDIKLGHIQDISFEKMPFDEGKKLFVIGEVKLKDDVVRYFSMPLAKKADLSETPKTQVIRMGGQYYTDALLEPDFWKSFMTFMKEHDNHVVFGNGWTLERYDISHAENIDENAGETSKELGVEQSNTTLNVGNGKLAFKLERMLEFSGEVNSELEMNEKLMRENASVMPKSFGTFIWRMPDGRTASSGIVQEFVKNKGDMWNYLLDYLEPKLKDGYLRQTDIKASDNPEFMQLIRVLSEKTKEMGECFARADDNPHFTPEKVDDNFIKHYRQQFDVLTYQAKRNIVNNLDRLPADTREKAEKILETWDETTSAYVENNLARIRESDNKGTLNRVHGDFHLGQVMVTPDNDLKFIDFAGEPGLSMVQRQQKHLSVRDVAGMYRSIKGYLGAVAVEDFAKSAPDDLTAHARKTWAHKAIKPLIDDASRAFLGNKTLQSDPWLALEVLRKNFYEIDYELNNRPEMAYIPVGGLSELLGSNMAVPANENFIAKDKAGNDKD